MSSHAGPSTEILTAAFGQGIADANQGITSKPPKFPFVDDAYKAGYALQTKIISSVSYVAPTFDMPGPSNRYGNTF